MLKHPRAINTIIRNNTNLLTTLHWVTAFEKNNAMTHSVLKSYKLLTKFKLKTKINQNETTQCLNQSRVWLCQHNEKYTMDIHINADVIFVLNIL